MIATLFLMCEFENELNDNLEKIRKKITVPVSPYLKKKSKKSIEALVNQNSPLSLQNKFWPAKLLPRMNVFASEKDSSI